MGGAGALPASLRSSLRLQSHRSDVPVCDLVEQDADAKLLVVVTVGCGRLDRLSEIPSETEFGQAGLCKRLFRKSRLPIADDSERWRWTHGYREEETAAILRHTPFPQDTRDAEQLPGRR